MKTFCPWKKFTNHQFLNEIEQLNNDCILDFSVEELAKKEHTEFNIINEILSKSLDKQLESIMPRDILICAIKCLVKYGYQLKVQSQLGLSEKKCIGRYSVSIQNYKKIIAFFRTDYPEKIIKIVINTIQEKKLWLMRRTCFEMCIGLYDCGYNEFLICNELCDIIETADLTYLMIEDYKSITKILYQLLGIFNWSQTVETELFIKRLMSIYFKSLHNSSDQLYDSFFTNLRGSLELCVTYIVHHISNKHILIIIQQLSSWTVLSDINSKVVLNYGSVLEYAAFQHEDSSYTNTFTPDVFPLITQMISSEVQFVSLLGNRVFQSMLDRNHNKTFFNSPKIFFPQIEANLKIQELNQEDVTFLTNNREVIHNSLLNSILKHKIKRSNLETAYCTICLLALEIPCGFSAAAICCLMMNLQETIRKYPSSCNKETNYHIHAIIISIMSFICWIHDANDFHDYVNKILMERGHWAPHLNPPLKTEYVFAAHHITYDKPELYLKDWEVRYGLWRKFRLNVEEKNFYNSRLKDHKSNIIMQEENNDDVKKAKKTLFEKQNQTKINPFMD